MPTPSTYLRYLPPVLWEKESPTAELSLGTLLCVFEKILTGINNDGVPQSRPPIEKLIEQLPQLFDPWQTPSAYLPWLASWVGLTIPDDWDEYRRRQAIGEMIGLYRERGSVHGLARLLAVYTAGPLQPRIVIDDGSKLLAARLDPLAPATIFTLQSQGPCLRGNKVVLEGLVSPQCMAVDPDGVYFGGDLFVGDQGYSDATTPVPARLWRLSTSGAYPLANGKPQPLLAFQDDPHSEKITDWSFNGATAVAIRKVGKGQVWFLDGDARLYKLKHINDNPALGLKAVLFSLGTGTIFPPPPTAPPAAFNPVAMVVNPAAPGTNEFMNDLVFLDRGPRGSDAQTKIWILTNPENSTVPGQPFVPLDLKSVPLRQVKEPLSIAVLGRDEFLIGDGGVQTQSPSPTTADMTGNLVHVRVDRSNPAALVADETVILPTPGTNPLVSPVSIIPTGGSTDPVLVLDTGLKPALPKLTGHSIMDVAKPAAVYRVALPTPTTATLVTEPGRMVFPKAMALVGDMLYVCDPGMAPFGGQNGSNSPWRVRPYEFGVVLHFPLNLLPVVEKDNPIAEQKRTIALNRIQGTIRDLVNREIPAHASWRFFTQAGG